MWRDFIVTTDPPSTKGHIGPYDDRRQPLAVIGCSCDYCFREMINSDRRREEIFGTRK